MHSSTRIRFLLIFMLSTILLIMLILSQQEEKNFQKCTPRTKIIYLKTHKTGSTTLQNIFYRFGFKRKLMFLLPKASHFKEKVRKGFHCKTRKNYLLSMHTCDVCNFLMNLLINNYRFIFNPNGGGLIVPALF